MILVWTLIFLGVHCGSHCKIHTIIGAWAPCFCVVFAHCFLDKQLYLQFRLQVVWKNMDTMVYFVTYQNRWFVVGFITVINSFFKIKASCLWVHTVVISIACHQQFNAMIFWQLLITDYSPCRVDQGPGNLKLILTTDDSKQPTKPQLKKYKNLLWAIDISPFLTKTS